MTISSQDLLIAVRRKLIASSTITALVQDRIHTTHFYDFDNGTIELPAIIIEQVGGEANYGAGNQSSTLYLYAYSKESSAQSGAVYDAVFSALHAERIEGDTIKGFAQEVSRPISGYNSVSRSYFSRGSFLFLVAG